jgi:hypothetical protein
MYRTSLQIYSLQRVIREQYPHKKHPHEYKKGSFYVSDCANLPRGMVVVEFASEGWNIMPRNNDFQFANIKLNRSDEKEFRGWSETQDFDTMGLLTNLGGDGYKVSLAWIDKQNAWCVTLVATDGAKHNKNRGLSSWSDDLEEAIWISGYKHYRMCDGGSWPDEGSNQNWG